MKKLSIIVPVYNVEPYLERCLQSLENQDIPKNEYEIICVNDGSTDKSREIIITYQVNFGNIILLDQENKGVSAARNRGIDLAQGEYVLMIDADDYIKPCVLRERLEILKTIDPEIAYAGHIYLDENAVEVYRFDPLFEKGKAVTGIEFVNFFLRKNKQITSPHSSVSIFIKKVFLEEYNLRYLPGVPYLEDGHFLARINCLSKKVTLINDPIYLISRRPGSAVNSNLYFTESAREGFIKAAHHLLDFREKDSLSHDQKIFLNHSIAHFVFVYLISNNQISYRKNYTKIKNSLKTGPLARLRLEGCSRTYRNLGRSYNTSIHLFYIFWLINRLQRSLMIRANRILRRYWMNRNK